MGGRQVRGAGPWALAALLLIGALLQACTTDNKGPSGPTYPAKVVGDAIGGPAGTINIQASVSPGIVDQGRRASVTIMLTSPGGAPLPGRTVFVSSPGGRFDQGNGTTDQNGVFQTTMFVPCEVAPGPYTITAVVEGKSATLEGAFTVATSTSNDPCAGAGAVPPGGGGGAAALPVVSIAATTSTATDTTGTPGIFTVSRNASSASPLQVFYTVAGTAVAVATCPGGDYVALSGSVTIPANGTSATITVTPCIDAVADGGKTVIVTISGDPAYSGGGNATVTIND
jgi:hypothetical protein